MSYLTNKLNTVGYNVNARRLSKKLLFCNASLFFVAYVIIYYFLDRAYLSGFTSSPGMHCYNAISTSITGNCPRSMCGIVVGRQYLVSSVIYKILIYKHIKCWACTVFNMCQSPSCSSA